MAERAPYLGPARRRGPVLEAALRVFSQGGFEAASMSAIAKEAEVSKAVLYDCFPGGKQEMYFALLDKGEKEFAEHVDMSFGALKGRPLRESIHDGMRSFLSYADVNPDAFRLIFGSAGSADPAIVERVDRGRNRIIGRIRDSAMRRVGLGEEYATITELYARAIVALSEEMARWSLTDPGLNRDVMAELASGLLLDGLKSVVGDVDSPG